MVDDNTPRGSQVQRTQRAAENLTNMYKSINKGSVITEQYLWQTQQNRINRFEEENNSYYNETANTGNFEDTARTGNVHSAFDSGSMNSMVDNTPVSQRENWSFAQKKTRVKY
jgi:hypothetical protein